MHSPDLSATARGAPAVLGADPAHGLWRRAALALACAGLVAMYAPTILWLFGRWTISVWHHAHGLLIPPVVGYFVYRELQRTRDLPREASPWGFVLVVPALALHAIDAGIHTELLSAISLVLLLPGLAFVTLGAARARAIVMPLAFLAFALPIPLALTEQLHWQLRLITTAATTTLVPLAGIPVFVEGTTLHLSRGVLQVGDACSGFSTLYASCAIACLTAFSTHGRARRLVVLLAAAPLAIAANIIRVTSLVLLVQWRGEGVLDTFIHPLSGMLTFALALPVILWLGRPRPGDPAT